MRMHNISKQIFKICLTHIMSILMSFFSFTFKTVVSMLISLSIFSFWYSIQYLGNINLEVLL